jgi:hypothetical protein
MTPPWHPFSAHQHALFTDAQCDHCFEALQQAYCRLRELLLTYFKENPVPQPTETDSDGFPVGYHHDLNLREMRNVTLANWGSVADVTSSAPDALVRVSFGHAAPSPRIDRLLYQAPPGGGHLARTRRFGRTWGHGGACSAWIAVDAAGYSRYRCATIWRCRQLQF